MCWAHEHLVKAWLGLFNQQQESGRVKFPHHDDRYCSSPFSLLGWVLSCFNTKYQGGTVDQPLSTNARKELKADLAMVAVNLAYTISLTSPYWLSGIDSKVWNIACHLSTIKTKPQKLPNLS